MGLGLQPKCILLDLINEYMYDGIVNLHTYYNSSDFPCYDGWHLYRAAPRGSWTLISKELVTRKGLAIGWNDWNCDFGDPSNASCVWCVWSCSDQRHLGSFSTVISRGLVILKKYCRVKIWDCVLVECTCVDLQRVEVILGSFGALFFKIWPNLEIAHHTAKHKNWVFGGVCGMHMDSDVLKDVEVILGSCSALCSICGSL